VDTSRYAKATLTSFRVYIARQSPTFGKNQATLQEPHIILTY